MRFKMLFVVVIAAVLLFLPQTSAAHFIVGKANDALDTTTANGRTVVIWNPANGITDNITDTIGPTGNSGVNNTYMGDCELLSTACAVGDEIRVRVLDDGFGYTSHYVNASVSGFGFDVMPNITLNSPPNVTLVSPVDGGNVSGAVTFQCDVSELDSNGANVTLYGNWSGGWHANETVPIFGVSSSVFFNKSLSDGVYEWNCLAYDNLSASDWAENNQTVIVDSTPPVISDMAANETYMCGTTSLIRVNCTVTDALAGIDTVLIQSVWENSSSNTTASILSGDTYYADIPIDVFGEWEFSCIANDSAGNKANTTLQNITAHPAGINLQTYSEDITLSNSEPIENENISIHTRIYNDGCTNSGTFHVGFYDEDPDTTGEQINGNQTINVPARSNTSVNVTWLAQIGPTNIYTLADVANTVSESNESDNKANKSIAVGAWQDFYGIINSDKLIANNATNKIDLWANETITGGNIFIADSEHEIAWNALQAIGRNTTNSSTTNDFNEIDTLLNMSQYNDSVTNTFTTDGNTPKNTLNTSVNNRQINNIPIINSTNTTTFITGILWDTTDDTTGEFNTAENEDLIFITQINKNATGYYGTYDYELRIPVALRQQNPTDTTQVYLYYELDSG